MHRHLIQGFEPVLREPIGGVFTSPIHGRIRGGLRAVLSIITLVSLAASSGCAMVGGNRKHLWVAGLAWVEECRTNAPRIRQAARILNIHSFGVSPGIGELRSGLIVGLTRDRCGDCFSYDPESSAMVAGWQGALLLRGSEPIRASARYPIIGFRSWKLPEGVEPALRVRGCRIQGMEIGNGTLGPRLTIGYSDSNWILGYEDQPGMAVEIADHGRVLNIMDYTEELTP